MRTPLVAALALLAALPTVAHAQDEDPRPLRTRIGLGPAIVPSFPGADDFSVRPYIDFSRTRDDQFEFEAPDESTSIAVLENDTLSFGPVVNFEGKRRRRDVGGLDEVGFSVELGGYVQLYLGESFRLRAEARQGVTGHKAFVGTVGADYVARDGDRWLFSLGPRVTFGDAKYNRTYFGVTPQATANTAVPTYRPDGGVNAVGGAASAIYQLSPRWGLFGFAKYDRLVGDAHRSPVVRRFGSSDQWSGGLGLSYTFGRGVN